MWKSVVKKINCRHFKKHDVGADCRYLKIVVLGKTVDFFKPANYKQ